MRKLWTVMTVVLTGFKARDSAFNHIMSYVYTGLLERQHTSTSFKDFWQKCCWQSNDTLFSHFV